LKHIEPPPIQSANSAYGADTAATSGDMRLQLCSIENKLMKF
jgi:hypothetical protein